MRKIKNFLFFILFTGIIIVMAAYLLQEKFIFYPTRLPQEYVYNFDHDHEELFIDTPDGARLNALHFKLEDPKGIIVYYHGNAGDLSRWGVVTSYFLQYNYEVLVMDYRTYGKSTGKLSEEALYADATLFYEKAKELFTEDRIVVYGRSLGTSIASYVAANNTPKKLILESPFCDFKKLVKEKVPYLPVNKLLKYNFPTVKFVAEVTCPITIIHGTDDDIVPYESGKRLFSVLSKEEEHTMVTVEGGGHNNLVNFPAYQRSIYTELQ